MRWWQRLRKQSDKATDPNELIGIEEQLRQAQAARDKYASVLDLLGASEHSDETEPLDNISEYQMQRAYERSRKELQEIGKDNNFVENDNDGKRPDENNSQRLQDTAYDGGGVAADAAGGVARTGDRSDIRVLAPQMAAPYGEYPDGSTRDRTRKAVKRYGTRQCKKTSRRRL